MQLRTLAPHETNLLREMRLRSLADAPDSFRDNFPDIAARPASYWEDFARTLTVGGRHVMFLAFDDAMPVGSAFGLTDRVRSKTGAVGGMWVDPAWRRRGVGEALLREVIGWGRERAFDRLRLWCVVGAVGPRSLYRKLGFRETGVEEGLSSRNELRIGEMELLLS